MLQSLKILLYLRPTYAIQLSQHISFGLHEILKTTAANIHSTEEWTVIFALLEYVGAGRVPTGNAFNQPPIVNPQQVLVSTTVAAGGSDPNLANAVTKTTPSLVGGLQHSLSQDPLTNVGPAGLGYSSGSDRGYTSDSELEIKSQNSSSDTTRMSSVSPAQSWILLTHNTIDENNTQSATTTVASPTRKSLQQQPTQQPPQQVNFTPDPKALVKSCETLIFLVRDAAHITPDNFTLCVAAIRSFVEACSIRLPSKSYDSKSGSNSGRKVKRGKRYQSPEHTGGGSSGIPKSKTFPTSNSNAYDADHESDSEADQIAASSYCTDKVGADHNKF